MYTWLPLLIGGCLLCPPGMWVTNELVREVKTFGAFSVLMLVLVCVYWVACGISLWALHSLSSTTWGNVPPSVTPKQKQE